MSAAPPPAAPPTRPLAPPELLRECTRLEPRRSIGLIFALHIVAWTLVWLGGSATGWRLAPLCFALVAGLQHHLVTLVHEAAHLLVHPRRAINDWLADVLCAAPFFTTVSRYRIFHLTHHKYAESPERDPEILVYRDQGWAYARRRPLALLRFLARDLLFVNMAAGAKTLALFYAREQLAGRLKVQPLRDLAGFVGFWGSLAVITTLLHAWPEVLLLWILPSVTLLHLFVKLHGYGEHTGATGPSEFERTWTHAFGPISDFFLYPIRSGFHLEHHLFPKVPWYHMRRFREGMRAAAGDYATRAEPTTATGYFVGRRTIFGSMLLGTGEYRHEEQGAKTEEIAGEVVSAETAGEVDAQLG